MKSFFKKNAENAQRFFGMTELFKMQTIQQEHEYIRLKSEMAQKLPESLPLFGRKVYSQTDEDGLIEEIFKRIPNTGTFLEIGIQTGVECNTHYLLLKGWKGVWIEGSSAYCQAMERELNGKVFPDKLSIVNSFVTRDNITSLFQDAHEFLKTKELDFFSLDTDGNDYYLMESLLKNNITPKVVCVEYNGKFPPPLRLTIKYNPTHSWDYSDYMGCSLQLYADLFEKYNYTLIGCNIPGINAFFVRNEYASKFKTYSVAEFYQPYRYHLSPIVFRHKPSLKLLRDLLEGVVV